MEYPSAFLKALLECDLEVATAIFPAGVDISSRYGPNSWTALHYVIEHMVANSARWLLEHGANPNEKDLFGQTPLHLAIDVEADCASHEYTEKGIDSLSVEFAKLLLEHGADPNARTNTGKTPLAWATSNEP